MAADLATAQHQSHSPAGSSTHSAQPYAAMDKRPVKSLSEQQIADLQAGRGMSLALPAELNGYPGPLHVLEHAVGLKLTPEQQQRTVALISSMKAETIPLGHRYIAQESELNTAFANSAITADMLAQMTASIAQTQAALRAAHLRYHIAQKELLTADQLRRYAEIRGYDAGVTDTDPKRH
jgi:hypothetical protein